MLETIVQILFYGGAAVYLITGNRIAGLVAGVAAAILALVLIIGLLR